MLIIAFPYPFCKEDRGRRRAIPNGATDEETILIRQLSNDKNAPESGTLSGAQTASK